MRRLLIYLLVAPFLCSCAGVRDVGGVTGKACILENVPFFPQEDYQCGPASLAGVLNYWGVHVPPQDITRDIYSRSARGTLDMDLVFYAERRGLKAILYKGSREDLKERINSGYPLIVLVDLGFWVYQQNHYMVVIGYHENGVIVNSGREQNKVLSWDGFLGSWERANFWTLLISGKG